MSWLSRARGLGSPPRPHPYTRARPRMCILYIHCFNPVDIWQTVWPHWHSGHPNYPRLARARLIPNWETKKDNKTTSKSVTGVAIISIATDKSIIAPAKRWESYCINSFIRLWGNGILWLTWLIFYTYFSRWLESTKVYRTLDQIFLVNPRCVEECLERERERLERNRYTYRLTYSITLYLSFSSYHQRYR